MNLKARLRDADVSGSRMAYMDGFRQLSVLQVQNTTIELPSELTVAGVALCFDAPCSFIRAVVALDGQVSKLLLLSPDLSRNDVLNLKMAAGIQCLLTDRDDITDINERWEFSHDGPQAPAKHKTEWLMTTSGTTGLPKVVAHTLESLTVKLRPAKPGVHPVWGLLYEPSRFAGLQVVLQSLLGGGCLVAPNRTSSIASQLSLLTHAGCTHLSGTPSLWRKLLMSPGAEKLALQQITLGGETADERVLSALADHYPNARITQIYASTEAGVGFSSHDAKYGFPLECLDPQLGQRDFKIMHGELWVKRPQLTDALPAGDLPTLDESGYFCTGDLVEVINGRIFFRGRRDDVANVGGTKIHIEDVEGIIRQHDQILDCRVSAKASPILGTVLTLQVVARNPESDASALRADVNAWCRAKLPRAARPVTTTIVAALHINASGKVTRVS
jgi:acyl-CoA synthetase (AMP-forming)/AMP-acid ligase II